jgi:dolichyl-phosphate-mannose--protein O-mannosyl transferase
MPQTKFIAAFVCKAVGLLVIPALVFILSFAAHFHILSKTGPGDGIMSSAFQTSLEVCLELHQYLRLYGRMNVCMYKIKSIRFVSTSIIIYDRETHWQHWQRRLSLRMAPK